MTEEKEKQEAKKQEKPKMVKATKENAKTLAPGANQKYLTIMTDGEKIHINVNNINKLELEMMLMKALKFVQTANIQNK